MATQMSKSQLIEKIATTTELSKRDVKNVMDTLTDVGHKELKKKTMKHHKKVQSHLRV